MASHDPSTLHPVPLLPALGALLVLHRRARGYTQRDLAARASVHPMALSKLERGVPQDVRLGTLEQLAWALEKPVSELLRQAERLRDKIPWTEGPMPTPAVYLTRLHEVTMGEL